MSEKIKIGVLSLQGDFDRHLEMLDKIGAEGISVISRDEMDSVFGLIIPGGESTTISLLIDKVSLREHLLERIKSGMPIFGTCAGAIILASNIINPPDNKVLPLKAIDITIERNAYGRQVDSFEASLEVLFDGKEHRINGIFIRAPKIKSLGKSVNILGKLDDEVVIAEQGNILISTFHPELSGHNSIHRYFFDKVLRFMEGKK